MRLLFAQCVAVLLATGCSGGAASASPVPHPSATTVAGGCGSTPIYVGGAPAWLHKLEGSLTYQEIVPHVLATPPTAAGFLYGFPLRAGHPENPTNKILWLVKLPPFAGSLDITAHPAGAATPTVNQSVAFLASGDLPSIVDMPQPGCWHFDLAWSGHHATVELEYL